MYAAKRRFGTGSGLSESERGKVIYDENGVSAHLLLPDRIMEVFNKNDWWQAQYAAVINKVEAEAQENARVFSILAPTQIEFADKPEGVSDPQDESIAHINSILSDGVIKIDAYNALSKRLDEFVYFNTDNHWTARGASYAYEEFCKAAGFQAIPLTDYNEHRADGMKGLFWDYIPKSSNIQTETMYYYTLKDKGFTTSRPLVSENNWYYGMFIDGGYVDYYDIETSVKNNKTAIVLKDSFAHCFIPFIAPHYERVIVLDPRFLKDRPDGFSVLEEAKKYDNVDFIFINYILATTFYDYVTWLDSSI
jgi:hypothetical protein